MVLITKIRRDKKKCVQIKSSQPKDLPTSIATNPFCSAKLVPAHSKNVAPTQVNKKDLSDNKIRQCEALSS